MADPMIFFEYARRTPRLAAACDAAVRADSALTAARVELVEALKAAPPAELPEAFANDTWEQLADGIVVDLNWYRRELETMKAELEVVQAELARREP